MPARTIRGHQESPRDPWSEGLKHDYILGRNFAEDVVAGRLNTGGLEALGIAKMPSITESELLIVRTAIAGANAWYHAVSPHFRQPESFDRYRELEEIHGKFIEAVPILKRFLPALTAAYRGGVRSRAQLNGTVALVAVYRWRAVHGSFPESLEAATAEAGLESVPIDPYSNQPLRYRLLEGEPVVYSVGSDLKDDGGTVDWQNDTVPGDYLIRVSGGALR